ncbi:MAG TPA: hypothetical protein VKV26_09000 [Dehalococcoidia bacterium]|nr:hypothetical protein [Dehalococcoidia bacterium]
MRASALRGLLPGHAVSAAAPVEATAATSGTRVAGRYRTALKALLIEQGRNHTALLLLVGFVPLWYGLMVVLVPADAVAFRFRVTGQFLQVNGQQLSLITAGLNAITLIVGFVLFSATRRGMAFDRRLALAGYPRGTLLWAKLTALTLVSAAVALYASVVLLAFWRPGGLLLIFAGCFCAALTYGAFGFLLGVLVRGELEGFFLVIMLSLMDAFLQNPIGNPAANKDLLAYFPTFAPTQLAVAGGFTSAFPDRYIGLALAWAAAFALLGSLIFAVRTRIAGRRTANARPPAAINLGG